MVGESIYVTVPVSNDFNTSLRLKRSHLLWKFTPEDGGETFSNDKQDNKSPPYVKVYKARNEYFLFKRELRIRLHRGSRKFSGRPAIKFRVAPV